MDSLLGFKETATNLDGNHKLVPWLNWDEWDLVRQSLFSSSPDSVAKALRRIEAWRSRGCLPVVIEVTASIIEIQQKDPHFRVHLTAGVSDSEEMLSMLYTMAIMRLVNGVIEKTRKKREVSIAEAAAAFGIPRMLIDIRHEGSHRDLPSLRLLRLASVTALNWLKSYYWIPQKNAIPYQSGKSANVRKEIRSRLRELAFILKMKRHFGSSSSEIKGKRAEYNERLVGPGFHGRNKFFSLMAGKSQSSKYVGSRKQLARNLRNLARLYSFFSSDVVSVLLEFLLKAPNATVTMDFLDDFQINLNLEVAQAVFDEWKPVIIKFSKQEPELPLSLLKAILDIIESRKTIRDDFGGACFSLLHYDLETHRIAVLSSLFTWLVLALKGLKSHHNEDQGSQTEVTGTMPKPALIELMRRCLNISDPENHELVGSALLLGKMADSSHVNEKLHKLSLLTSLYSRATEDHPSDVKADDLIHQDKHLRQAAEKLELLKCRKGANPSALKTGDDHVKNTNIWTVAKSWNPCPIGMLPRAVGSSGCLPVLDHDLDYKHEVASSSTDKEEHPESRHGNKREPCCDIETTNDSCIKRMRETENFDSSERDDLDVNLSSDGLKGRLLIGGVWRRVGDQELQDIKSRVGILVTRRKR